MTRKLFYENQYLTDFTAEVVSCEKIKDGRYATVLDRTAFYPEGGGISADSGTINGISVCDVKEKDGEIIHYTEQPVNGPVSGSVDFNKRFDLMQQHSGEHIVSGVLYREYGFNNVGFHVGNDVVTLDTSGQLSEDQIWKTEDMVNEAIFRNIEVRESFDTSEFYRSKKELTGTIRIIEIPGYDRCACCGLHVSRTGEIGIVKIIDWENYKGGMRITIVSGKRALSDYRRKNSDIYKISELLSAKPESAVQYVKRLDEAKNEIKFRLTETNLKYFRQISDGRSLVADDTLADDDMARLAGMMSEKSGSAAVISESDGKTKYALSSNTHNMKELCNELNTLFNGKGGGKPECCRGFVQTQKENVITFLKEHGFKE